ncbi:MAG: hypothetical protein EB069_09510, partial [Actinobacteria bacterium]|nr:hypothetical protein [Actinomycetota bacterium]
RLSADGSLDSGFGLNGRVNLTPAFGDIGNQRLLEQSDGKILRAFTGLVAASNPNGAPTASVERLLPDGNPDLGFGKDGVARLPIMPNDSYQLGGRGLAIQADGKLLMTASVFSPNGERDVGVFRLNQDGTLDTSFSGDGFVKVDSGRLDAVRQVGIQSTGKIVVVSGSGEFDLTFVTIHRFTTNGELDSSFGDKGKLVLPTSQTLGGFPWEMRILSDDRILIQATDTTDTLPRAQSTLILLSSEGISDRSFSDDGYATLSQDSFVNGSGTLALIQGEPAAFVTSFQKSDGSTSQSTLTAWDLKGKQLTSGQLTPSYYDVDRTELSVAGGKVTVLRQVDGPLGTALLLSRVSATDGTADGGFDPIATVNSARLQFKALDPTILVVDADLESLGSYAGASVLLSRRGGANADDQFSYPTTGGLFNQAGQPQALVLDGITVADVLRNTAGVLELRFTPQATPRTTNQALQSIQYANDRAAPGDSLEIEWIFNDGNTGAQAVGTNDVSAKTAKSYTRVRFVSNPSDSADRLVGSTAADTIDGLAGNDTMDGMA